MQPLHRHLIAWLACAGLGIAAITPAPAESVSAEPPCAALESLRASLVAGDDPRALVLASMMPRGRTMAGDDAEAAMLRERAAAMADGDAFVQWFAFMQGHATARNAARALRLVDLDPGNGAMWLAMLDVATRAGDEVGVTAALNGIGTSTRFDDFHGEATREWMRRMASGDTAACIPPGSGADAYAKSAMPLVSALALGAATALPAYQDPVKACRAEAVTTRERADACAAAGRLAATEGTTLIARLIGLGMLRATDEAAHADLRRQQDDFRARTSTLFDTVFHDDVQARLFTEDWLETGSEVVVLERLMARSGVPLEAPPGTH